MLMPEPDQQVIDRRDDICRALRKLVPAACVVDSTESMRAFDADGLSAYRQLPLAVVLPETVDQIAAVMKWCHQNEIKLVPRGAGTSLSGGALPLADAVLLGLGKFNRIHEIDYDNRCVVAQPGVTNLAITHAVQADGFYYAPDPSSQIACSVGGNVAENSGGVHCLKYGLTTNNLLGVEIVTMEGEILRFGGKHLDAGDYDLMGIMTGSEGLLGVVSEVTLRILQKPATARALLVGFDDTDSAGTAVGDVIAFITTLILLVQPVRAIGTLNAVTNEAIAAADRVLQLLDRPNLVADADGAVDPGRMKGAIRFSDVGFAYDAAGADSETIPALVHVDFDVKAGQTVALCGPSGSGKSTIINLLPRFFDATAGQISIDGTDIRQISIEGLRRNLALVSQDAVLFDDTIAANIAFGRPNASRDDIVSAAEAAAAHDFIMALDGGYDAPVGTMGNRLSGGQRQRISIARAMLKDAPILLLDEATAALDAESEQQVQEALARLQQGRTTLVVAHRLSTIHDADQILVMDGGTITERGTHAALVAKGGLYARLSQLQSLGNGA